MQHCFQKDLKLLIMHAVKKPLITKEVKVKRLLFAKKYSGCTEKQRQKSMCIDEIMSCSLVWAMGKIRRLKRSDHYEQKYTENIV